MLKHFRFWRFTFLKHFTGNLVIIDEELFQERHIDVGEHFNRTEFALSDDESCQGLEADVRQDRDHCRLLDRG